MKKLSLSILLVVLALVMAAPIFAVPPQKVMDIKEGRILNRFFISDIDTTSATLQYYGYIALEGNWYILCQNNTATTEPTFRYAGGTSDYTTSWTNRGSLIYVYFNAGQ